MYRRLDSKFRSLLKSCTCVKKCPTRSSASRARYPVGGNSEMLYRKWNNMLRTSGRFRGGGGVGGGGVPGGSSGGTGRCSAAKWFTVPISTLRSNAFSIPK
ncbi:MAG: hypothetical protein DMG33_04005 [Acidobacteria bacterium]|nr:MAG: hypothetical protein DMG33_04005 [Acidobacteriota bacterium]